MDKCDGKEFVLKAVKEDGWALEYVLDKLRDDKEFVLKAVKRDRWKFLLEYASERLRGDKEFVLEAVKRNVRALMRASERLKDKVKEALSAN
jgi:hypothetical protein